MGEGGCKDKTLRIFLQDVNTDLFIQIRQFFKPTQRTNRNRTVYIDIDFIKIQFINKSK